MLATAYRLAVRPFQTGSADVTDGRMLMGGALVWGAYSVIQILINGIVLDEALAPAQIIAGAVQYPAGHPHQIYYLKAYNLFHYLAAGAWAVNPAPLAISAARNFLFLFSSAFAPFAIAVLLTRRALWGHIAAALTVAEVALRFEGIYPMWVFPSGNSNGHLGLHAAMFIVVLLLARLWRTGGLLLGLLPALHPAMPLVIWPWSGAYLLFSRELNRRKEKVRFWLATGQGLGVCGALAIIIFIRAADAGADPPYNVQPNDYMNGELIHRQFTATTDVHRRLAPLWWFAYSVGPVALFVIGSLLLWTPKRPEIQGSDISIRRTCFWLLVLSGIASMYVYGAMALQYWRGALPVPIGISMPYRFANITSLLLVPVTVAAMAWAQAAMDGLAKRVATAVMAGLIFAAGMGFFSNRHPESLYVLWGLLLAMDFYAYRRHPRRRLMSLAAILAIGGVTLAIGGPMQLGAKWIPLLECLLASFVICLLAFGLSLLKWKRGERRQKIEGEESPVASVGLSVFQPPARRWLLRIGWGQVALLCACLATSLTALPRSSQNEVFTQLPRWDMISQYDRELSQWLAAHARPGEMILPAITPQTKLQPRTGHPVLMEAESLYLMSYMPSLAPTIGTMARDLYGVDYADRDQIERVSRNGRLGFSSPFWHDAWKNRKRRDWQALGRKYGFRLTLSPNETPLDLPVVLPGTFWSLYEIPEN